MDRNHEHLSCAQILLLKFDIGLTTEEKLAWQLELKRCEICKARFKDFNDRFDQQAPSRKNLDIDVVSDLMAVKNRELPMEPELFLENLYQKLFQLDETTRSMLTFPSLEEAKELPIPVPENLKEKIYQLTRSQWRRLIVFLNSQIVEPARERINALTQVRIEIRGFAPALGALMSDDEAIDLVTFEQGIPIEHVGGDLELQVGKPGIKVALYSEEAEGENYLLVAEAISNQEGIVHFEGIWKGNYRLLLWAEANILRIGMEQTIK